MLSNFNLYKKIKKFTISYNEKASFLQGISNYSYFLNSLRI